MNLENRFYPESKFGGFTDVDGTIAFFNHVNSLLKTSFTILDVGCGRGEYKEDPVIFRKKLRILKGKVKKVIGIDVDPHAKNNPYLDKFILLKNTNWPIKNNSVDLVLCDWVVEHLENPDIFFIEVKRVLRKKGYLCIRTPNKWGYPALFAQVIDNKYHSKITSFVQSNRKPKDVFPTRYRCNTLQKIKRMMKNMDFDSVVYGYSVEPSYLYFSSFFYFLGVIYQKSAPNFLKQTLFAFGQKKT